MIDLDHQTVDVGDIQLLISEPVQVHKGTILHLHGLPGGELSNFKDLHTLIATRGYRVISFNYPGLWQANGQFSIEASLDATRSVLNYITVSYTETIRVFAESFGAYIISELASETEIISHIFYRAPLPGFSHYQSSQQMKSQLLQSMMMMVQSGLMKVPDQDIASFLPDQTLKEFEELIESLEDKEVKMHVCIGKDDEIIPVDRVITVFDDHADLEVFEHLPHNAITRDMWIELITRADIFFQQ